MDDDGDGQTKSPLFGMKVLIVDLARNAGAIVHALSERSHFKNLDWSAIRVACEALV